MNQFFPIGPVFLEQGAEQLTRKWVMPNPQKNNRFGLCKVLPPGMPDCLHVDIIHTSEGIERCTAAFYGGKAYVIYYELKKA